MLNTSNNTLWIGSNVNIAGNSIAINGVRNYGLFIYDLSQNVFLLNDLTLSSSSGINTLFLNNNNIYVGGIISSYNGTNIYNSLVINDNQTLMVKNNNGITNMAYYLTNGTAFVFYYSNGVWKVKYGIA